MKNKYPQIKLILILPCKSQTAKWKEKDIKIYEKMKLRADKIIYTSENSDNNCMIKRNHYMVENASYIIAAWDGRKRSGTFSTINYAKKLKRKVFLLDMENFKKDNKEYRISEGNFEYGFDFSKNVCNQENGNFDKLIAAALKFKQNENKKYYIDEKEKKKLFKVRNAMYCIAKENQAKMKIINNNLIPCVFLEVEGEVIDLDSKKLKQHAADIINTSKSVSIEARSNGKFAIMAEVDILKSL